jgi:hypothetical protein
LGLVSVSSPETRKNGKRQKRKKEKQRKKTEEQKRVQSGEKKKKKTQQTTEADGPRRARRVGPDPRAGWSAAGAR